jgi:hypothetical protein
MFKHDFRVFYAYVCSQKLGDDWDLWMGFDEPTLTNIGGEVQPGKLLIKKTRNIGVDHFPACS